MARNHFVLLALALSAIQLKTQAPKPHWEVDLARFGYQGRPLAPLLHVSPDSIEIFDWAYQQGIAFIDANVVVAYFVVYDAPFGGSEAREPRSSDPFRLVAVFLNAKDGEPLKQLDWALPPDSVQVSQSFFYPATHGRFIVVLGNTVNLYSSDFKPRAHFEAHGEMTPIASPSGESLLLKTFERPTVQYDLLDTEKLSVLKTWSEPVAEDHRRQVNSLWGDRLAWTMNMTLHFGTSASASKELLTARPENCDVVRPAGNHAFPRPWCDTKDDVLTVPGSLCGGWQLIGKESVAGILCSGDDKLLTVSTEGKILHEFNLGLEQADGPMVASANGQRFAIPTTRWGRGTNNIPDRQAARVFALESGNPLLTVDVRANQDSARDFSLGSYGDSRFGWGGLALSPDGNLLAVKSGGSVRIYSVPEQAPWAPVRSAALPTSPPPRPRPAPKPASPLVKRMLTWFPADTETLTGVTGPLLMPKVSQDAKGILTLEPSPDAVRDTFKLYFLSGLLRLENEFKDAHIAAAIGGSRLFGPSIESGTLAFQTGVIAVFTADITDRAAAFIRDSASTVVQTKRIEGQLVEVFQAVSGENTLTTYVAFPKPDIAVVASDEYYLGEILARIGGKQGSRALPETLPEWKYVDTNAELWALRHNPETQPPQSAILPPSCPVGQSSDAKLIGVTFSYGPGESNLATIDYLSQNEDILRCIRKDLFPRSERGVAEMQAQYIQPQPGVLEGSYNLDQIESAQICQFLLLALLGYPVAV